MCDTAGVSAAQQSALQTQIQISVLAKQQSAVKQSGEAALELLQAVVQMGKSVDTGLEFDATA